VLIAAALSNAVGVEAGDVCGAVGAKEPVGATDVGGGEGDATGGAADGVGARHEVVLVHAVAASTARAAASGWVVRRMSPWCDR
jgi:hypothetical protein